MENGTFHLQIRTVKYIQMEILELKIITESKYLIIDGSNSRLKAAEVEISDLEPG